MLNEDLRRLPTCLTVPGLGGSGPDHWQSVWERERRDCRRIELGCWDSPQRNLWIGRIDEAVRREQGPVVLVAHSLGCLAVAWWAGLLGQYVTGPVVGALLVAPPDVDRESAADALRRFAPTPRTPLPFPAILMASSDDPYCGLARAEEMAAAWLADFVAIDDCGHVNAASRLGAWQEGQAWLDRLLNGETRRPSPAPLPIAAPLPRHAIMR
jgi:predicted alpha/beta hydrolase family esterase